MANVTTILYSYRSIQVMSQTLTLDCEYCICQTIPHQLGFNYAVPYDTFKAGDALGLLDVISTQLEGFYANGEVVASSGIQDIDKSGLISDWVAVVVEYNRDAQGLPPLQGTVNIPAQAFFNQETGIGGFHVPGSEPPNQYVVDEYDRLRALAGG